VLANIALREGRLADVEMVVMDEFHFYAEPDRGWAWQVPLLELTQAQFVLMSATLGDTTLFEADLTRRTGRPTALVANAERPVPLTFEYVTTPVQETIEELLSTGQAPVYIVHVTQVSALERAQALASINVATRAEKDAIADAIGAFRFNSGFGKVLSRLVRMGIGVHHAGMLPRYRRLVETLAQQGLLKVICGTDTLGVGINVPIRTVLFTGLSKYDGTSTRLLRAREFHQIAGRAGRAGFDTMGRVVVQAPEHVVENEKALAKAGDDPKKRRKVVGSIGWGEPTYERLTTADPEPLTSSFSVTNSMLLNVIARKGDAFESLRSLLRDNHEPRSRQTRHVRQAVQIYRGLLAGEVVQPLAAPDIDGRRFRLTVELGEHFALNQPLSAFAVAAFDLLDRESPSYALDVVSVVEATLDDPRTIISAQRNKARGDAIGAMKSEGIEYEERMELLEDVEHPQPLAELLFHAFDTYRRGHPWVGDHQLRPKSVVRDMFERAMTFTEYVSFYSLARTEGMVLRYLTDAYRALRQSVPETVRNEELVDLTEWLGELVRQVDSSLLDEWEMLAAGQDSGRVEDKPLDDKPKPVTGNLRAFRVLVRNAMFRRVELAARRRYTELGELDAESGWDVEAWREVMSEYFEEHDSLGWGPEARGSGLLVIDEHPGRWVVRQIFDDPEGHHDWGISAEVDLAESDEAGFAVIRVTDVGMR
jgi:superfamily II RNA helicase